MLQLHPPVEHHQKHHHAKDNQDNRDDPACSRLPLPVVTTTLIHFSRWIVSYGWILLLPLTIVAGFMCLAGVFSYIGWLPRNAPLLNRMFRRYDGAIVLRSLALSIRRGQPLHGSLRLMADIYPLGLVRSWLGK